MRKSGKRRKLNVAAGLLIMLVLLTRVPAAALQDETEIMDNPEGYELAAASGALSLYFSEALAAIIVEDNRSGARWYSAFPEDEYPEAGVTEAISREFSSLLLLQYSELNLINAMDHSDPIMALDPVVSTQRLENGVQFTFFVEKLSLEIAVDFVVEGDGLLVRMPQSHIRESVGTEDKIRRYLLDIRAFLDMLRLEAEGLAVDSEIPDTYKQSLGNLVSLADALENEMNQIKDASRIESAANGLLNDLEDIRGLYAGNAQTTGIYNGILLAGDIADQAKNRYRHTQTDLEDLMTLARISAGSLKTISVGGVVAISVLPYLGAAGDSSEGYVFYPDGSGALTHFKKEHASYTFGYNTDIYTDDTPNIDWEKSRQDAGIRNTLLPVFGIRKNGNAFVAAIESGDSNALIQYSPSGYIVDVNRACFAFSLRRKITRDKEGGTLQQGSANRKYEDQIRQVDCVVRYLFLDQGQSDYSGMANRLREQMIKDGRLARSAVLDDRLPVGIELLGGVGQTVMIYDSFVTMTTYDQASQILADLSGYRDTHLLVNYRGWSETGLDQFPTSTVPEKSLGGLAALHDLADLAHAADATLLLELNPIEAQAGEKGYNSGELAMSDNLRPIASSRSLDWLLSPGMLQRKLPTMVDVMNGYGIGGITFDLMGTFIYYDYSLETNKKMDRQGTAGVWRDALNLTRSQLGAAAVKGGNGYSLSGADWIIQAPSGSSEYVFTDESIPFYQMLVHGSIPYVMKPFNSFYNEKLETLKTIEYGGIPYFVLAWEDAGKLQDLNVSMATDRFDDVRTYIDTVVREFGSQLGLLSDQAIVRHQRLDADLVQLIYADGSEVLINYSAESRSYEGQTVDPMDYLVKGPQRGVAYEQTVFVDETERGPVGLSLYLALGGGICLVLCLSLVLLRRSRLQSDHRSKNE